MVGVIIGFTAAAVILVIALMFYIRGRTNVWQRDRSDNYTRALALLGVGLVLLVVFIGILAAGVLL